jgi:hypothetical protein
MAVHTLAGRGGSYAIDWEVLLRICRAHVRARAMLSRSRIERETQLFGPDISWVEVDWEAVKRDVNRDAPAVFAGLQTAALAAPEQLADYARTLVAETAYYRDCFHQKQTQCSRATMKAINTSVDRGENAIAALTAIRDLSADFVLVGATALSGGAAVAAVGGGSILKGSYKWQDTQSVSAGVFTASTELLFAVVPLKLKKMGTVQEQVGRLVLAKVKAGVEVAKTVYVDHGTVTQGVVAGALKANDPGLLVLAKTWMNDPNPKMKLLAVPAAAVVKFARDRGVKAIQRSVAPPSTTGSGAARHKASPVLGVTGAAGPTVTDSLFDAAPFDGCSVEEMGICRM